MHPCVISQCTPRSSRRAFTLKHSPYACSNTAWSVITFVIVITLMHLKISTQKVLENLNTIRTQTVCTSVESKLSSASRQKGNFTGVLKLSVLNHSKTQTHTRTHTNTHTHTASFHFSNPFLTCRKTASMWRSQTWQKAREEYCGVHGEQPPQEAHHHGQLPHGATTSACSVRSTPSRWKSTTWRWYSKGCFGLNIFYIS